MVGFQGTLSFISACVSLAVAIYIISKNPRGRVNLLGGLMGICLAWWALGDSMVAVSQSFASKIFWIRFQAWGELPLPPLYFTLALYFPSRRRLVRDGPTAARTLSLVFLPFLATIPLVVFTDVVYPSYTAVSGPYGIIAEPSGWFWAITGLGFGLAVASSILFLQAYRTDRSGLGRAGLLPAALAPLVLIVGNVCSLILAHYSKASVVSTPHFSFLFIIVLGYGVLRYGLFLDPALFLQRSVFHFAELVGIMAVFGGIVVFMRKIMYPQYSVYFFTALGVVLLIGLFFFPMLDRSLSRRIARSSKNKRYHGQEALRGFTETGSELRDLGDLADSVSVLARECMNLDACALLVSETPGFYRILNYDPQMAVVLHLGAGEVQHGALVMEGTTGYTVFSPDGGIRSIWLAGLQYHRRGLPFRVLKPAQNPSDSDFANLLSMRFDIENRGSGLLWMGKHKTGSQWDSEDLELLQELEPRLSLSIKNAQLLEEVITQRERLRELARRAQQARESERVRISRELHDSAAQLILDVIFKLESLDETAGNGNALSAETIGELKDKSKEGLRELRRVISDLRPPVLEVLGLQRSLETWAIRFGRENGIQIDIDLEDGPELDELEEITIFRLVQEALANVARHADADYAGVRLQRNSGNISLIIEDDGRGFDMASVKARQQRGEVLGLSTMEERVEMLMGDFSVKSQPGKGTKIEIFLPR